MDDVRLEVRSDPRLLAPIRSLVRSWLGGVEWAEERADEVVLAVDEACANAIRHSYEGRCDEKVTVVLRTVADGLEVMVSDTGVPCPPGRVQQRPLASPSVDELRPGGLGVQLMYRVFDEVEFASHEPCGNRVTMRLARASGDGR